MVLEEQLRSKILEKHKSVREFANYYEIPNSTVDSVLKRGIYNSGVGTVIKIFDALNLDLESVPSGTLTEKSTKKSPGPDEAEPRDEIEQEAIRLVRSLELPQKALALSILQTIAAESQRKPGVDQASASEAVSKIERQGSPK